MQDPYIAQAQLHTHLVTHMAVVLSAWDVTGPLRTARESSCRRTSTMTLIGVALGSNDLGCVRQSPSSLQTNKPLPETFPTGCQELRHAN
jgi:hypothetical protein